jgi:hypothetical protein
MPSKENINSRAGWSVNDWCRSVGVCRATAYNLLANGGKAAPKRVKIRGRTIIVESPSEYLARLHDTQVSAA